MVTLETIRAAKEKLTPYIYETPVIRMQNMDRHLGCQVYVKAECMQLTNSFKIRGALNKLLSLPKEELGRGVIAASSGNHGKGIAYGAKLLGAKATIVVPDSTPDVKVKGIEGLGAQVVKCSVSERYEVVDRISAEHGYIKIHPYDDYDIMSGQGTIGLELMQQLPEVDTIVVPVSGGGLIGGISTAVRALSDRAQVVGAESAPLPRYSQSLAAGQRLMLEDKPSVADALRALTPGERNFPVVQKNVSRVVAVEDEASLQAMRLLLMEGKLLAEASSSVGMGAVLSGKLRFAPEDKVCFVLSGGNVGFEQICGL